MHHAERIVMTFRRNHREGHLALFDRLQLEPKQTREWRCRSFSLRDGPQVFDAAYGAIHEGDKIPSLRRPTLGATPVTLPSFSLVFVSRLRHLISLAEIDSRTGIVPFVSFPSNSFAPGRDTPHWHRWPPLRAG